MPSTNTNTRSGRSRFGNALHSQDNCKPILIVEDDRASAALVRLYLVNEGYKVIVAYDGAKGLALAREHNPILIVLDLMLPKIDGLALCQTIRAESSVPIIMVTARVAEDELLAGLDLGADDYVPKPFSPRELTARVGAVLRRSTHEETYEESETIEEGNIFLDMASRETTLGQRKVQLTPTEFRLLAYFMRSVGRAVSREQIISNVFGYDFEGFDRTVDTHISNLRRKLQDCDPSRMYVRTVYGIGYRFEVT